MVEISNSFASIGRNFGNKLFTYGVARIFAKELGLKLIVPPGSYIKRAGYDITLFPYGDVNGNTIDKDEYYVCDRTLYDNGLINTINACREKKVSIDGYFSKYEYIKPFKNFIKEIYNDIAVENDNKNDVVIMLRDSGSDSNFKLPNDYYLQLLEKLSFNSLYVCFDHLTKHKALLDSINHYSPKLIDYNIIDTFKFITSKNTIIACQGTFSFWASFLSSATKIFWPMTNKGPNTTNDWSINLKVDNEDRYEFINLELA
jgi:hypothetical protein